MEILRGLDLIISCEEIFLDPNSKKCRLSVTSGGVSWQPARIFRVTLSKNFPGIGVDRPGRRSLCASRRAQNAGVAI